METPLLTLLGRLVISFFNVLTALYVVVDQLGYKTNLIFYGLIYLFLLGCLLGVYHGVIAYRDAKAQKTQD